MKIIVLFFTTIAISMLTFGQTYNHFLIDETQITPPKFAATELAVHGQFSESINEYLSKHVHYPIESYRHLQAGTEVVQFEVSSTGELSKFLVINSVSSEIDDAVIRVLETTSGNWMPGSINEEPVAMRQEVSLVFKANERYDMIGTAKWYQDKGNEKLFVKKDPKRALKFYNRAIKLLPYEESLLAARCLCRNELGDEQGAIQDLDRIMALYPEKISTFDAETREDYISQLNRETELNYLAK